MTPLQKIAMGLVIVLVDALFAGYDAVPDPIGWILVIAGVLSLRAAIEGGASLVWLAAVSLLASVATYPPQVSASLDETAGWLLSLPQLAFTYALCGALVPVTGDLEGRFRVLRWLFVVAAIGPVMVLSGAAEALRDPLAFVVVAADIYLVYLLFRASRGLPGPADDPTDDRAAAAG